MATTATTPEPNVSPADLTEFLTEARERYEFGRLSDQDDREHAEDDNRFAYADDKNLQQWDPDAVKAREKRPTLQWNRLPTSIQQVANDGRENKPSIRISPEDNCTPETAEFFQSRIRHVEYDSNASTAKDTARDQQITSGRGFVRVSLEYIPGTWRQRICIDRIENQFSVVWDPGALKYDRTDADWCFVVSQFTRDAHIRKFGAKSVLYRMDFADAKQICPKWIGIGDKGNLIQVAEYWRKEYKSRRLLLFATAEGDVPAWKDQLSPEQYATFKANGQIREERDEQVPEIHQYIINGLEVLDHKVWVGSTIPIVPFWGKEAVVDNQRRTFSLIRNAKTPQRTLNLLVSNLVEKLQQQSKSPLFVPVGGIPANAEPSYAAMAVKQVSYLLFNAYNAQGQPLPRPERADFEPPIQALVIGIREAIDAIKAAMGIYDAALGAKSNETSGIAIERRKKESDVSNYHFPDNEARSNKYLGEILVELIPLVDQPGMEVPVRSQDGKTHKVPIGKEHKDWKTGKVVIHDLTAAQVGVSVDTGPSYTSQRQEQFDRDAAIITAQPEMLFVIGDQMYAADDTAGAEDRADRLKRYIEMKNPGLIQDKQQEPISPEVQQQLMSAKKDAADAHAFAQSLHEQIQTEQVKAQNAIEIEKVKAANAKSLKELEIDFDREKLALDSNVKLAVAGVQADIVALREELSTIKHERGLDAQRTAQQDGLQHEADQADAQRKHEADQAQESHAQTLEQQQQAHAGALEQQDHAAELQPKETE